MLVALHIALFMIWPETFFVLKKHMPLKTNGPMIMTRQVDATVNITVQLIRFCVILRIISERELKFMFAICHRPSVCRLSVVCNVGAPYSGD